MKLKNERNLFQDRVHDFAKRAGSLSVNDANGEDPTIPAFLKIGGDEFPDFLRPKRMEIECAVNRNFNGIRRIFGFIHDEIF